MNPKFYELNKEKQNAIFNAALRIFSQNSYKKSPTSAIAEAAKVSKSLLFHYFKNKKELYLFTLEICNKLTLKALEEDGCFDELDFFEAMSKGLKAKIKLMRQYPHLTAFALKSFYEDDPEVEKEIKACYRKYEIESKKLLKVQIRPQKFQNGLEIPMMYQQMRWIAFGFLWERVYHENRNIDEVEKEFESIIKFWKNVFLKKEAEDVCN